MEISVFDIKRKSDLLCRDYYQKIFKVYLIINSITIFIQLIPNAILSIVLSLVTVTLSHAYVIVSIKLINNNPEKIEIKDSFAGFKSFVKVFPAYLMRKIILIFICLIIVAPAFLLLRSQLELTLSGFLDWIKYYIVGGFDSSIAWVLQDFAASSFILMASAAIATIVTTVFSYGFALVPYLLEAYDTSWMEALIKSWQLMKGHKRQLLMLQFLYFPRMIFVNVATNLLTSLLYFAPILFSLPLFFYIYAPIVLWLPQMQIAYALFFEVLKVDDEEKNRNQLFRI